jgi:hypothetical protein
MATLSPIGLQKLQGRRNIGTGGLVPANLWHNFYFTLLIIHLDYVSLNRGVVTRGGGPGGPGGPGNLSD